MGKVIVLPETTKDPISLIGRRAGICWEADITNEERNYKRGLDCLESNHGRTLEYVNVEVILDGYSARTIRQWYTHNGGAPTRLQSSTRYIDYKNFEYVTPNSIAGNEEAKKIYDDTMRTISENCQKLELLGIPREDSALSLPLGMCTKMVDKRNLRNVIDMSRQRKCTRAYWEYRQLFHDYETALKGISDEWAYIVDNYFMPKCEAVGYCTEKKSCGRKPKKGNNI